MMCYAFTLVGAILGDKIWGKFKTIAILATMYAFGFLILSVTSIPNIMPSWAPLWSGMAVGLSLIAFGTGGIKPCVSAFGGDQLDPVTQARELASFFALFYFSVNCGSVLSMVITPLIRTTECFGNDCFPLAFFTPFILMVIAVIVFACGSSSFVKQPPSSTSDGPSVLGVLSCALW